MSGKRTVVRLALALLLLLARFSAALESGTPPPETPGGLPTSLVLDAAQEASRPLEDLIPRAFYLDLGGVLLFSQDDGVHGSELWRTDGTALGTYLVRDICPGSCDGVFDLGFHSAAAAGGLAFFAADDGVHGIEPWASDGTPAGTRMVRDVAPGRSASRPTAFLAAGNQAVFAALDGVHGQELWRSDGSPLGTSLLFDSIPGPASAHLVPYAYCDVLYAAGDSGLWRIDGPPAGGTLLAAVYLRPTASLEDYHLAFLPDCRLVFSAGESDDEEPWVSDGTPAGTFEIADLYAVTGSTPFPILRMGSDVVFLAHSPNAPSNGLSIWTTDGTLGGVSEFVPPAGMRLWTVYGGFAVAGDKLYLAVTDPSFGVELGVWDGATLSAPLDINPGPEDGLSAFGDPNFSFSGSWFRALGSSIVFPARDPDHGFELWRSDGTTAGTERVSEIGPGPVSGRFDPNSQFLRPLALSGRLLFRTWDPAGGHRLWSSDGTFAGTQPIEALNSETSAFFAQSSALFPFEALGSSCVVAGGARVIFETEVASRSERRVFGADASGSNPELLAEAPAAETFRPGAGCVRAAGTLLFFGSNGTTAALYSTDGTSAGTTPLVDLVSLPSDSLYLPAMPPVVSTATATIGFAAGQVLATDGTPGGTTAEPFDPDFYPLTGVGLPSTALFGAFELLASDGTAAGTIGLGPESDSYPAHLEPCFGGALFFAGTAASGRELWWSDGTAPGAHLVADIVPGPASSESDELTFEEYGLYRDIACLGARAVFVADDGVRGEELWVTDGTEAGTALLADLYLGSYPSRPRRLTRVDDRAFFAAETDLHGLELWVTDGTEEGTHLVRDIVPGQESSVPQALTAYKNLLLFSAWTPQFGREAWRSDGTPEGTVRITDLAPGPESSSPDRFAVVGDRLFFAANDLIHGFELFTLVDPELARIFRDAFESGDASRWGLVAP